MLKREALALWAAALLLALAASCQAAKTAQSRSPMADADSWQSNRAVMRAGESSGNMDMALAAGRSELEKRPGNKEARLFLARVQTRAGQGQQALYTLEPLLGDPEPGVAIELARAELSLGGQTQKALARLDAALSSGLSPELERAARKLKAIGEDLEGRHGEAQKIYAQLLIEKDEPSVRFNYGRSLLASRRYSEAVAALRPILDEPRLAQARVVAAAALASQNDKRAAKSLLESYLPAEDIDRLLGAKK